MKQHYIENQARNQNQQSILDALSGQIKTSKWKRSDNAIPQSPLPAMTAGRFRRGGRAPCKGPPGRSRSPGTTDHLFPEHPPDHCPANENQLKTNLKPITNSITVRQCAEIHLNTEYQIFNKIQFLNLLNFLS